MGVITKIFGNLFKPNDWKIIHKEKATYKKTYGDYVVSSGNPCYFYLKYSESRNKYKITYTDYFSDYENSEAYQKCLDKQIELQK